LARTQVKQNRKNRRTRNAANGNNRNFTSSPINSSAVSSSISQSGESDLDRITPRYGATGDQNFSRATVTGATANDQVNRVKFNTRVRYFEYSKI